MSAPPDALRVEPADDGNGPVLALRGELTFATAAELDPQLDLARVGPSGLVLDVSGLEFCDSTGLAALIGLERRVRRAGGVVRLRGVHGPLRRVLQITGVDVLFADEPVPDAESG